VVYLSLEVHSSRTCQITFIVRLLHRRAGLAAHHHLESGAQACPYKVRTVELRRYLRRLPASFSTMSRRATAEGPEAK
jgi:hypothetical protein